MTRDTANTRTVWVGGRLPRLHCLPRLPRRPSVLHSCTWHRRHADRPPRRSSVTVCTTQLAWHASRDTQLAGHVSRDTQLAGHVSRDLSVLLYRLLYICSQSVRSDIYSHLITNLVGPPIHRGLDAKHQDLSGLSESSIDRCADSATIC